MSSKYLQARFSLAETEDGFTQTALHERLACKQKENAQTP